MKKVFLLSIAPASFAFVSYILVSCAKVKNPDWITKPYKNFNPQKYIVGVGVGYSKDDSDKSARTEILKQIKVDISEKLEVGTQAKITGAESKKESKKEKFEISEAISKKIREEIDGTLEGVIISERFFDKEKGIWYSLAVFDKSEFVKRLLREISEMDSNIFTEVKRISEGIFDLGRVGQELKKFVEVEKKLATVKSKEALLRALGGDYKAISQELFERVKNRLSNLRVSLRTDTEFSEPITYIELEIFSDIDGMPAEGVPVRVKIKNGFSEKVYTVLTDENGRAKIADVVFFDYGQNRIEFSSDLPYVQILNTTLVNSRRKITFEVDSPYTFLKSAISKCILQKKLEVSESQGDYKIVGDLSYGLIYSGKNYKGEPLYISQALIVLSFVDPRTKVVIFEHSFSSKGVGETDKDAILRSVSSAISNLCGFAISEKDLDELSKSQGQREKGVSEQVVLRSDYRPFDLGFKPLTDESEAEIEIIMKSQADGYLTVNGMFLAQVKGGKIIQGQEAKLLTARLLTARLLSQSPLTTRSSRDSNIKFKFPLQLGENSIKIEFVSDKGDKYAEIVKITRKAPDFEIKAKTHIVAVGISRYKNSELNLKYARVDAEKFIQTFQGSDSNIIKIVDEDATRENIIRRLFELVDKVEDGDRVFLFFAGHGVRHRVTGAYYFMTYDAGTDNFTERALKWSDVIDIVLLLSRKLSVSVVLFLDTCHSGAYGDLVGAELGSSFPQLRNVFVLSSSSQDELSYESDAIGHGLFTFALVEGVKQWSADLDKDGVIMLSEFFSYISKKVKELSGGKQRPFFRIVGNDIVIASK